MPSERSATPATVHLGEILRADRNAILLEWEAAVRATGSRSAMLDRDDLLDDVPRFVDRLIAWIEGGTASAVDCDTTGKHARHRLGFGIELRHLIHEYHLLRHIMLCHAAAAGCWASPACTDELVRLNDVVDDAMCETASAYARERDRARDLILGILGHDLRNPLAAVAVAATRLLDATSIDDVRGVAARIKRSADRIQRVVGDLLDLARSRFGGRMPMTPELLDLGELVRATVEELQLANPSRRLIVERFGDVRGSWDRARMGQLVSNLVGNAIQHGIDPIHVSVAGEDGDVVLRVSNAGEPIPKEVLPSLFDPFRRGGGDDADVSRLGLGLYIVAEITRHHRGTIDVESTSSETIFTVRLPRVAAA